MFFIADVTLSSDHLKSLTTRWQFHLDVPKCSDFNRDYAIDLKFIAEKYIGKLLEQNCSEILDVKVLLSSDIEDLQYNTLSKSGPKVKHQI